jgi:hypothetical protein
MCEVVAIFEGFKLYFCSTHEISLFFFLDSILDIICHIYEIHCRNLENLLSIEGMLSKILKILSCILAQGMNFRSLPFILF